MGFERFAGQAVAHGIDINTPLAPLENNSSPAVNAVRGLMLKIGNIFIEDTKIFGDPFGAGGFVRHYDERFGGGMEIAQFVSGAPNKKKDGKCFPRGEVELASETAYTNYAYSIDITIGDREVDKSVMNLEQASNYAAQKVATAMKTVSQLHYQSWKQLLSCVVDGTRNIESTDRSDGLGQDVDYEVDVTGYAGQVSDSDYIIPAPSGYTRTTIPNAEDALNMALDLEAVATAFKWERNDNNLLEIENFVRGRPLLFMEAATLNAMDAVFSVNGGYQGFPTVSARDFLGRFADIVEIDIFPEIPTNEEYTGRLGAVLMDRDALFEITKYADVEAQRCAKPRSTGYNYSGESIMHIWKGAPSYAMLVKESEESEESD